MVTTEERKEIIAEAVEQVLRMIPEVVGNLMVANAMYSKLTKEFYASHKDFAEHKDIVQAVVSKIEGSDPTKNYSEILSEAVPKIKSVIESKKSLSMDSLDRSEVDLSLNLDLTDNGML